MIRERQTDVKQKTEQLLAGPLKHARAAALAAALVPLASVAVSPAQAQEACSGGAIVGDIVWHDVNANGIQDGGESGIAGAVVTIVPISPQEGEQLTSTDEYGYYLFLVCGGTYKVIVQRPNGMQTSPPGMGTDPTVDSNGADDTLGNSVAEVTVLAPGGFDSTVDFGFWMTPVAQPGTGTPGYWKNHPAAWPVQTITVGGVTYTKDQAIAVLWSNGSDRTLTMFSSLVPAMLNVLIGNDGSCVSSTIEGANDWMKAYGPAGKKVHPASPAWKIGERLHRQLDNYNNGMLCAPHRE
jgi:hypothetical protein